MNILKLIPPSYRLTTRKFSEQKTSVFKSRELRIIKKFSQNDLNAFSQLTGDSNYIHTEALPQDKRKVHGAFLNAIVAGIIGTQFPGAGSVVLEQTFSFPKACRIEVDCEFLLQLQQERKISIVSYECKQNNEVVFKGQAKLLLTNNNSNNKS